MLETLTAPESRLTKHSETLERRREKFVGFIGKVHWRSKLSLETLILTINILDRCCAWRMASAKLSQFCMTALYIAKGYHGEKVEGENSMSMTNAESKIATSILKTLDYNLSYASPPAFMWRIAWGNVNDAQLQCVAEYLAEVTLSQPAFLAYRPSSIAAAAMFLARFMVGLGWVRSKPVSAG